MKETVKHANNLSADEMRRYELLCGAVLEAAKEYKRMSHTRTRLSRHSKAKLMEAVSDLNAFERHFLNAAETTNEST